MEGPSLLTDFKA